MKNRIETENNAVLSYARLLYRIHGTDAIPRIIMDIDRIENDPTALWPEKRAEELRKVKHALESIEVGLIDPTDSRTEMAVYYMNDNGISDYSMSLEMIDNRNGHKVKFRIEHHDGDGKDENGEWYTTARIYGGNLWRHARHNIRKDR